MKKKTIQIIHCGACNSLPSEPRLFFNNKSEGDSRMTDIRMTYSVTLLKKNRLSWRM